MFDGVSVLEGWMDDLGFVRYMCMCACVCDDGGRCGKWEFKKTEGWAKERTREPQLFFFCLKSGMGTEREIC